MGYHLLRVFSKHRDADEDMRKYFQECSKYIQVWNATSRTVVAEISGQSVVTNWVVIEHDWDLEKLKGLIWDDISIHPDSTLDAYQIRIVLSRLR